MEQTMNTKLIPKNFTNHFSDANCEISFQWICDYNKPKPTIIILHALTGNSTVTGENGWWKELVESLKVIDTNKYNLLCIDTLGNGFATNTHENIHSIKKVTIKDIALINLWLLNELELKKDLLIIGGSLGGVIAWEMWKEQPDLFDTLFSIAACPFKDEWIKAVTYLQSALLEQKKGYELSRMWSMLFYRNAVDMNNKFKVNTNTVEQWLLYHGKALKKRFPKKSYKIMNHLLGSIGKTTSKKHYLKAAQNTHTQFVIISIASDWLFHPNYQLEWAKSLKKIGKNVSYHSLDSTHGHDAFLIEQEKLNNILTPYL